MQLEVGSATIVQRDFSGATEVQEVQLTTENGSFLNDFSATTVQHWCNNSIDVSATSPIYIGEVLALIALALLDLSKVILLCSKAYRKVCAMLYYIIRESIMNYRKIMSNILEQHLTLSGNGWRYGSQSEKEFQADRDWMLSNEAINQFISACKWISLMQPTRAINPRAHSFVLKHRAERYLGTYIANGVFIATALHFGFWHRKARESPNCRFNMSQKRIKEYNS